MTSEERDDLLSFVTEMRQRGVHEFYLVDGDVRLKVGFGPDVFYSESGPAAPASQYEE